MKRSFVCFLLLSLLLFSACGKRDTVNFDNADHTCIFSGWREARAVTCLEPGLHLRYCRICHKEISEEIPVAAEIGDRVHDFEDLVIPPTESEWGYTERRCRQCGYEIHRADERRPLFALLETEATDKALPAALAPETKVLMSRTDVLDLTRAVGTEAAVSADLAWRFALTLTVTGETEKENGALAPDTVAEITAGKYAGRRYKLSQLLAALLKNGDEEAAAALASLPQFGGDFEAAVNARLARLGLSAEMSADADETTLHATGVLFARVLATPCLLDILKGAVPDLAQIGGETPAVYLTAKDGDLRVSARLTEAGYEFLLLAAPGLPEGAEDALYSV